MSTRRFCFEAFLPADKKERKCILNELTNETRTIIVYEAPHRLLRTLEMLYEALGERRITVCRELTKRYETVFLSTFTEALLYYQENEPKGECVIVIEGRDRAQMVKEQQAQWDQLTIEAHMALYISKGMNRKEAMKEVARDRGISKRDVYAAVMK